MEKLRFYELQITPNREPLLYSDKVAKNNGRTLSVLARSLTPHNTPCVPKSLIFLTVETEEQRDRENGVERIPFVFTEGMEFTQDFFKEPVDDQMLFDMNTLIAMEGLPDRRGVLRVGQRFISLTWDDE